jgi:uncharacterized protein involved in type VI secretion and phage assembly
VDLDGWTTDIQFGRSARACSSRYRSPMRPRRPDSPARGLQIAVVTQFKEDPDKELRVRVCLPARTRKRSRSGHGWLRRGGQQARLVFFPEVGDEVVVAFLDDDPRQPWFWARCSARRTRSGTLAPPDKKNEKKGLVTRADETLVQRCEETFGDDRDAAGNKAILDDDAGSIQLVDQNGNKLVMDKNGIQLKSAKDLKLEGSGNVTISGQKVDVK